MNCRNLYINFLKIIFDYAFALFLSILLIPIFIILIIGIFISSGRPIIFMQERVGKNCKNFYIYKFRTMPKNTKELTSPQAINIQLNLFSRILRRLSLDELPQIFNILKGEMSFVGPRPILTSMTDMVNERKKMNVYNLKPGITGLAQIKAYDEMKEVEKINFDREYFENISFFFDIKIIFQTILYLTKTPPSD